MNQGTAFPCPYVHNLHLFSAQFLPHAADQVDSPQGFLS